MTGEKSHTTSHPIGIRESRKTSRAMEDGSGNRGQRANLKVVVVGSMIIRNDPFVHSVSVLCPEPIPAESPSVQPKCSPCDGNFEKFGASIPEGDPLALLLATADKIDWLGRDSLAAFLQSAQGKTKTKVTTPEQELAQKESEYNKASANERLLEKKFQEIDGNRFERLRKQLQDEQDIFGRLDPALAQATEKNETTFG